MEEEKSGEDQQRRADTKVEKCTKDGLTMGELSVW